MLQFVAKQLSRRLGRHIALEDLIALGHPALMEVARTYQPNRAKFATYTALKVKWAILDGVRRETRSRSASARAAAVAISERLSEDTEVILAETGVPVTEEECQDRLRELLEGHAAAMALGLTASRDDAVDSIPDSVASPEECAARQELRRDIWRAVEALPDRERALIERHYFGGEPFDEIAKDLGVSKSWASRLHTQAIQALAKAIRGSSY